MQSSRISPITTIVLIPFLALVLSAVAGCAGASAMPMPTAIGQNAAAMPTATELASPTSTDVPAPLLVTATPPTIESNFQAMDGSRFDVREGFSFVPPKGWYYIGRWEFPFETQYVFSTLAAEHNSIPGQLNLVVRVVPNTRPDDWIRLKVSEKEILGRLTRQVAGVDARQVDFDQNRDPRPIELSAGTYLVIPDGGNLITFSAFGNTWNDYASYAAQVEGSFQSIRLEHVPPTPNVDPTLNLQTEFPLALGNTWVYQSTRYEAVPITEFITTTHVITETVIDIQGTPSYFAAKIRRDESAETPVFVAKSRQGEPLRAASSADYWLVVMGNQVFHQEGNPGQPDLGNRGSRELVFPLKPGDKWYLYEAKDPGVPGGISGLFREVLKTGIVEVPAGRFENCFFLKDDWADATAESWFCPGVGWAESKMDHNGTPEGWHNVLLRYHLSNKPSSAARAALERFMQARIDGDEGGVLDLLTAQLRSKVMQGLSVDVPLIQVSNPCWYRYQVLAFSQLSTTKAQARVRVYEHQWAGDNAGSLPESWEQEIGLAGTTAGWRVDALGQAENEHQEPNEPHGPTLSACTAWRQTPASVNAASTPVPLSYSAEFESLPEARRASGFSLLLPTSVPENLPFYKAWVFDYADGSQTVRILYTLPTDQPDANQKAVEVRLTQTDAPITLDSVTHQFRQTALDVREVQVRGQVGYTYWSPAVAQGNSAALVWREAKLNIEITLFGAWPQPTEQNPHALDGLLLKIAESLSTTASPNP